MDTLVVALVISSTVIVIAWMITRTISRYYEAKAALSRRMAAVRRGSTSKRQETREPAPWVSELLEQLGHSTDELYEDEPPDDLQALLESPLAKSLLEGLKGGGGGQTPPGPGGWV